MALHRSEKAHIFNGSGSDISEKKTYSKTIQSYAQSNSFVTKAPPPTQQLYAALIIRFYNIDS